MKQSTPPRSLLPPKDFLDDSASMTSSTITSREKFFRKTDEKSATRRSISRNSREKPVETLDISRFYMKMGSRQEERPVSPPRKNIINRVEEIDRNKKRSPTPLPGHHKKKEKPNDSLEDLQVDLVVCDLQKKLSSQQQEKGILAKRVSILEREIKVKLVHIQGLQKSLAESAQRQTAANKKLNEFQALFAANESSLSQARNSLQKLKNTIKQNKYMQIESDNLRLRQQNNTLMQDIQRMTDEAQAMNEHLRTLIGEVALLKKTNEHLANSQRVEEKRKEIQTLQRVILTSKTEKERTLEETVQRCNRQKSQLRLKLEKLELRLNFMQRKRNQQLDAVKQAKNQIIIKLRNKVSTIFSQNHTLRAQNDELRLKTKPNKPSLPLQHRKNNFLQETNEQNFRLELSP